MMGRSDRFGSLTRVMGAVFLAFPSCGPGNTTQTAAPVPQAELPDKVAEAYCAGLAGCCQKSGFSLNQAGCQAAWRAQAAQNQPAPANVSYDPNAAGQCLTGIRALLSACSDIEDETTMAVCNRVFVGTLPTGAACTHSEECADPSNGNAYCDLSDATAEGVCAAYLPPAHGTVGQACSTTCTVEGGGESCSGTSPSISGAGGASNASPVNVGCYTNDGLYCSTGGTCQKPVQVGGACDSYGACTSTAYCDLQTRLCTAKAAVGAACSNFMGCVAEAYCRASVCEAKKADGQPCTSFEECQGYCDLSEDPTGGLCTGAGASGIVATSRLCTETFGVEGTSTTNVSPPASADGGTGGAGG
jgi:hypothetical protein